MCSFAIHNPWTADNQIAVHARMRSTRFPLAAPTGTDPRDTADVLHDLETATPKDRLRKRVLQVGAGLLALLYAASYIAPQVAPNLLQWQGEDRYEKKEAPR
jgi:hypothetical protein